MGNEPIQLGQFKIGYWSSSTLDLTTGKTGNEDFWIPFDYLLAPGESYVFATAETDDALAYAAGETAVAEKETQDKMWEYADYLIRIDTLDGSELLEDPFSNQWGPGMNGFYIEQHLADGSGDTIAYDSFVVDQVVGMFTGEGGKQLNRTYGDGYDVAGVTEGTATCYLIRRFNVKQGNLDFANARGVGLDDSEWIPIPHHGGAWRDPLWTVGNHGDYNLDANTLESDVIEVDFANKTLTIPWGIRRGDDILNYLAQKPGVGWEYIMGANADSLSHAAQTGDQLLIYVCGDDLDLQAFDIVVKEPAANANMVVPVSNEDPGGNWRDQIDGGQWAWPRITQLESGNDSIWGERGGIPYATRVDSLLKRLEKPANAEWEVVYATGLAKPDLANGDKIKITAQDGSVKEYYIKVNAYRASIDATISAITWPDIPEFYKGIFGWIGDTIPGFSPKVFNYNLEVPIIAEGIPALVAKSASLNSKIEVSRATSLSGSAENRTINFTVTAEDDTTIYNYGVTLTKEKNPANLQPNIAEPFISEVIANMYWTNDGYVEIVNPGTQPLDLSNYLIIGSNNPNAAEVIADDNADVWEARYDKYIPGYKWEKEVYWAVQPYLAQRDISVNSIVMPGDVFVLGAVNKANRDDYCRDNYNWPGYYQVDVNFQSGTFGDCYVIENQWGEEVTGRNTPVNKGRSSHIYLFKILNDSIKQGLKSATDPNDYELIDVYGMGEDEGWVIDGEKATPTPDIRRMPHIFKGNPVAGVSMGVNSPDEVEWTFETHKTLAHLGSPWRHLNLWEDLGKHFMYAPTYFMSTISSLVYKVSEGYSMNEQIKGITTGTTVTSFLDNVIKPDSAQALTLTSTADGSVLGMDALLSLNDTLTVLSADSTNTSKYVIEVSEAGLSSNAVLTSAKYDITIVSEPKSASENEDAGSATITGFEYGTSLKTILANVTVPPGARMDVIDGNGAYVSLTVLNFDTTYVNVTVNSETYLDVIAENGVTEIVYQLLPEANENNPFILSDIYSVTQKKLLIEFVPRGTNVQSFLANLMPSFGASLKLVDKMGFERTDGTVADDDKVIVTSANEMYALVYHISKLASEYTTETTYLAYILSKTYMIDQVDYVIDNVSSDGTLTDFYSKITPSMGATAVVVDKDGMEKTTGNITGSDMVKVTSADGKVVVTYTFGHVVSADALNASQIELYPNPTNGRLNVSGLEKGQRIQVFNITGSSVVDIQVQSNREIISLDNEPSGLYMIVVSNKNKMIGRYKAIKN